MLNVIKKEAYRYSETPFQLTSGEMSYHYVDMRQVLFVPDWCDAIADLLIEKFPRTAIPLSFAGMTLGADPLVYSLARKIGSYPLIIRKEEKKNGTGGRVVGRFDFVEYNNYAIVDDVVTTAGSMDKVHNVLQPMIGEELLRCCVVDRRKGKVREMISLFTLEEIVGTEIEQ